MACIANWRVVAHKNTGRGGGAENEEDVDPTPPPDTAYCGVLMYCQGPPWATMRFAEATCKAPV